METNRRSSVQSSCELLLVIIGKGTHFTKRTGGVYDGDWKDDLRSGFGMYSLPSKDGGFRKVYAGGWKHDKRHVSSICSFKDIISCIPVLINLFIMFIKVT